MGGGNVWSAFSAAGSACVVTVTNSSTLAVVSGVPDVMSGDVVVDGVTVARKIDGAIVILSEELRLWIPRQ